MVLSITDADAYISSNCIEIDDWTECDEARKQRIINVAERILLASFPTYTIPAAAAYEFANVLTIVYNDTNRLAQQGLTGFSIDKIGSFDFKDTMVNGPNADLRKLIPQQALDIIGMENDVSLAARRVGWTVL